MPVDPNEIIGFLDHCTNVGYLIHLRQHLDKRILALDPKQSKNATTPLAPATIEPQPPAARSVKTGGV